MEWWATTWEDPPVPGDEGPPKRRLVATLASSAEEAAVETGLVREMWRPATEDEIEEWESVCHEPLTPRDIEVLARLVRRSLIRLGRDRQSDRPSRRLARARQGDFDLVRHQARKLAELRGRLEMLEMPADDAAADRT